MRRLALFVSTSIVGGFLALIGGVVSGGLLQDPGFLLGWAVAGVLAVYATVGALVRLRVVTRRRYRAVTFGAVVGVAAGSIVTAMTFFFGGTILGALGIGLGAVIADVDAAEQEARAAERRSPVA